MTDVKAELDATPATPAMDIEEIEKALGKITPGPWSYEHDTCAQCRKEGTAEFALYGPPGGYHAPLSHEPDASFIAKSPEYVAFLIGEVKRLTAERDNAAETMRERAAKACEAEEADMKPWGYNRAYHCCAARIRALPILASNATDPTITACNQEGSTNG